jgi:hypothetical protein
VVKEYVKEMLGKGFIRSSFFPYAVSVLVVKKPEGGLRVCVDYRALNAFIIKNRNAPSLIKEIIIKFCKAKIYTKLDVIAVFNKIRIRERNEEKIAFLTRWGLFEYLVMSFGLYNIPGTFQAYINDTFREYLDGFCTAYFDDIFIYNKNEKDHETHVKKVLE